MLERKSRKPRTKTRARRARKADDLPDLTYRIGYRCPPKHTQFKKGQSGNPAGRPRASERWSTVFAEEFARTITVIVNGKKTEVSVLDAIIDMVAERAAAGSTPHALLLLRSEYREPPPPFVMFFADPNDKNV
jgi:ribosomal protein L25 (general stress protein Ctc)